MPDLAHDRLCNQGYRFVCVTTTLMRQPDLLVVKHPAVIVSNNFNAHPRAQRCAFVLGQHASQTPFMQHELTVPEVSRRRSGLASRRTTSSVTSGRFCRHHWKGRLPSPGATGRCLPTALMPCRTGKCAVKPWCLCSLVDEAWPPVRSSTWQPSVSHLVDPTPSQICATWPTSSLMECNQR